MGQKDGQCLGSGGTQVRSLAWHSGLRIQCGCNIGSGRDCGSDLIPGPGTPYAAGQPKTKKKILHKVTQSKASCMSVVMKSYILPRERKGKKA